MSSSPHKRKHSAQGESSPSFSTTSAVWSILSPISLRIDFQVIAFRALQAWIENESIKQSPWHQSAKVANQYRMQPPQQSCTPRQVHTDGQMRRSLTCRFLCTAHKPPRSGWPPAPPNRACRRRTTADGLFGFHLWQASPATKVVDIVNRRPKRTTNSQSFNAVHTVSSKRPQYSPSWRTSSARLRIWIATSLTIARQACTCLGRTIGRDQITIKKNTCMNTGNLSQNQTPDRQGSHWKTWEILEI